MQFKIGSSKLNKIASGGARRNEKTLRSKYEERKARDSLQRDNFFPGLRVVRSLAVFLFVFLFFLRERPSPTAITSEDAIQNWIKQAKQNCKRRSKTKCKDVCGANTKRQGPEALYNGTSFFFPVLGLSGPWLFFFLCFFFLGSDHHQPR